MAKDLTEALRQLTEGGAGQTSRTDKTLPPAAIKSDILPRTGSSPPIVKSYGGESIASPLTETAYADRTYHASKTITSSDGLITWVVDPIKEVSFKDANDASVKIIYKSP